MNNDYLVERFESSLKTKDSSGRDELAINIFKYWYFEGNLVNYLFGFGFASTLVASKVNSFAHNDWVEILCNYGLFGLIIYFMLFMNLFALAFKSKQGLILFLVILLVLVRTMFSMFYTSIESFVLVMILAAFVGKKNEENFK